MKSTPPSSSHNRFACLPVEKIHEIYESSTSDAYDCVKAVPTSPPPPRLRTPWWERRLPRRFVVASTPGADSLDIPIEVETTDTSVRRSTRALVDCGATGLFMDTQWARANNITTRSLARPIPVFNVDGSPNQTGPITEIADVVLRYRNHAERAQFAGTTLGKQNIILGYSWLRLHNPEVNWQTREVNMSRCAPQCATCRHDARQERKARQAAAAQIRACRSGGLPDLVEYDDDDDEDETNPLDEGDRLFAATIFPSHQVRATSNVSTDLAADQFKNTPTSSFYDSVPPYLHGFEDIFAKEAFDSLPGHRQWDHAIELDCEPSSTGTRKVYPLSLDEQAELDAFLEEALSTGRIRPSKSPIGAPVFFVKKKDGKLRLVQDYRTLNAITRKNRYPLPLIDDLISRLSGARYFTKLDVRWGYNNVRIREGDEWKAAFRTNRGLFEPLVMYFGLTNSPATFQTMMNEVFHDLILRGVVCVYLDDILIFTKSLEEHREVCRLVLERMREHKLYLRHDKCEWEKTQMGYLGVVVSHDRVEMDPVKVSGVLRWPEPTTKKEVQSFLGFANFYRRFIADFSRHGRPLFDLTKQDAKFVWGDKEQEAFDKLKELVTSSPVLVLPNSEQPFRVEADGSGVATGAVLSQLSSDDRKWHPVAFQSKSLSEVERNYEIHDTEMLAIIRALEEWRHYLEGARQPIEIWTDHKNLEYFRTAQKLNRRQARWSLYLSRFDFTLHHRPGRSMGKPDALSRRADHGSGSLDNDNITLLGPELFRIHALSGVMLEGEERCVLRDIRRSLLTSEPPEPTVVMAREALRSRGRGLVRSDEWSEHEGLLLYRGKIYVPQEHDLRRRIVAQHHDSQVAGHPGRWKTLELISRNYWWPQMSRYVGLYVKTCDPCMRTKIQRHKPIGELHPLGVPEERWDTISVDFVVELPEAHGYDAILNVVDLVSKRAHFIPTHTTVTAEGAANLFYRYVWCHHGLPRRVVSDRGPQFVAEFTTELYRLLGISIASSTAYHPQTDGQTERVNQEMEQYLRLFTNERQNDWDDYLPLGEFSYNNHVHLATQQSPFLLDTGRHPRMGFEPMGQRSEVEAVNQFTDRMAKGLEEAKAALAKAQDEYARYYNRRRTPAPLFKEGDKVWLDASDIQTTRPSAKLAHRRLGPYVIEKVVGHGSYRLRLPPSLSRLHPVFPVVKLTLAVPDPIPGRRAAPPPPPELIEGHSEYEVEEVLDSRMRWRRMEYLVKWKGYDAGHNSWEPHYNLDRAKEAIAKFHRLNPGAPRRINSTAFRSIGFTSTSGRRVSKGG